MHYVNIFAKKKRTETSTKKYLQKDVGMEVPKSTETRCRDYTKG